MCIRDSYNTVAHLYVNAGGNIYRFSSNSRHINTSLPNKCKDFAAYILLTGLTVGHNALGSGNDRDAQAL